MKQKLNNKIWIALFVVIAILGVLKFSPDASTILNRLVAFSMKLTVSQNNIEFMKDSFSLKNIVENQTTSPMQKDGDDENKNAGTISDSLTQTPQDILDLMEAESKVIDGKTKAGTLVEKFYASASNTTSYGNVSVQNKTETQKVNIKEVLSLKPDLEIKDKSKPTVLIYHTHTTESYTLLPQDWYPSDFTSRSSDPARNMVRVGEEIVQQLEAAGFNVIHDKTIYDASYNGAYARSAASVDEMLAKYPTIDITIDVHRDAVSNSATEKVQPVAEIQGKKAAQIMIITGCQEGDITDYDDWEYNLRFALQLQKKAQDMYEGLMRPVFFAPRKYNMNKTRNSLLLEIGSDGNTLEQSVYSGRLIGNALAELLEDYVV